MPTTRSSKRPSEAFASLPEPPKRQRKRLIPLPVVSRSPTTSPEPGEDLEFVIAEIPSPHSLGNTYTYSLTLEPTNDAFPYVDAATQTHEELHILTQDQLDAAIDEAIEKRTGSNKRNREDDGSSNTPQAKRLNLTPTVNSGHLFLFNKHPDTAPVNKSTVPNFTPARIVRGPHSSRNVTPLNRHRKAPTSKSTGKKPATGQPLAHLKPVDLQPRILPQTAAQNTASASPEGNASPSQSLAQTPVRRSLFGSLRGLAKTGIEMAINFSPIRHRPSNSESASSSASHTTQDLAEVSENLPGPHNVEEIEGHEEIHTPIRQQASSSLPNTTHERAYASEPRRSRYEHLHYIKPGSEEERKLQAGHWVPPPRIPSPPDEFEVMKKRDPTMPDGMIRNLLARRAKRLSAQGFDQVDKEPPKIAPLFGPDSHYARGTLDPRFVSPKAYRMFAKHPMFAGGAAGSKRTYDVFEAEPNSTIQSLQPSVEDEPDEDTHMGGTSVSITESEDVTETPVTKRQRTTFPVTPRSAMKKQGDPAGSIGRSGRSVNFNQNPVSGSRGLRAHYGPAGQYKGSTFADLSSPTSHDESTLSSLDREDVISPSTQYNTLQNSRRARIEAMLVLEKNIGADIPEIDFTLRDPNNPEWRPTLFNPRPGTFRVPDVDEEDMEEDGDESISDKAVPPQPSTPRMSHAELPATPNANGLSFNESSIQSESTELALEKARSKAQKYKPKDSSRLSEVPLSLSRSPSPESHDTSRPVLSTAPAVQPLGLVSSSRRRREPYTEAPLDKVTRGEDGMTDYEREHQYDEWAAGLPWGEPQTYEDAGTGTKEIHDLIRKNWTPEDDRRGEEFWQTEFDNIELLQKKAKARGQMLQLLTGLEDMEQYIE